MDLNFLKLMFIRFLKVYYSLRMFGYFKYLGKLLIRYVVFDGILSGLFVEKFNGIEDFFIATDFYQIFRKIVSTSSCILR